MSGSVSIIRILAFLVVIRNGVFGECLLVVKDIMIACVAVIEPSVNGEVLAKGFDNDGILIRVSVIEAAVRAGFKEKRYPLRIE
ncbi:hypothetical protein D3C71_1792770 [compost metagenome]